MKWSVRKKYRRSQVKWCCSIRRFSLCDLWKAFKFTCVTEPTHAKIFKKGAIIAHTFRKACSSTQISPFAESTERLTYVLMKKGIWLFGLTSDLGLNYSHTPSRGLFLLKVLDPQKNFGKTAITLKYKITNTWTHLQAETINT